VRQLYAKCVHNPIITRRVELQKSRFFIHKKYFQDAVTRRVILQAVNILYSHSALVRVAVGVNSMQNVSTIP